MLQLWEPDAEVEHGWSSRAKLTQTMVSSAFYFLLCSTSFRIGSLADSFIVHVFGIARWLADFQIGWISDGKRLRFDRSNWAIIGEHEGRGDDWNRWNVGWYSFFRQMSIATAAALFIVSHSEHTICDVTLRDENPPSPGFHFEHFCDGKRFVLTTDAAENVFAIGGQVCHERPLLEKLFFVGFPQIDQRFWSLCVTLIRVLAFLVARRIIIIRIVAIRRTGLWPRQRFGRSTLSSGSLPDSSEDLPIKEDHDETWNVEWCHGWVDEEIWIVEGAEPWSLASPLGVVHADGHWKRHSDGDDPSKSQGCVDTFWVFMLCVLDWFCHRYEPAIIKRFLMMRDLSASISALRYRFICRQCVAK